MCNGCRAKREEVVRKLRLRQRNAKKAAAGGASGKLVQGEVSEADIARIISKWTGGCAAHAVQNM